MGLIKPDTIKVKIYNEDTVLFKCNDNNPKGVMDKVKKFFKEKF